MKKLLCWLRGHRWVSVGDEWGIPYNYCSRCLTYRSLGTIPVQTGHAGYRLNAEGQLEILNTEGNVNVWQITDKGALEPQWFDADGNEIPAEAAPPSPKESPSR